MTVAVCLFLLGVMVGAMLVGVCLLWWGDRK